MRTHPSHIPSTRRIFALVFLLFIPLFLALRVDIIRQVGRWPVPSSRHAPSQTLADLTIVHSPLQFEGNVSTTIVDGEATNVTFVLTSAPGKDIDLAGTFMQIDYRDRHQRRSDLTWTWHHSGKHDGNGLLNPGEQIQVDIALDGQLDPPLEPDEAFAIDLKPGDGAILTLKGVTPASD